MKKNNTKKIDPIEEVKVEEIKKEEITSGGNFTKKMKSSTKKIILEKIKYLNTPFSIGIEQINQDTIKLIDDLWYENVTFIVSNQDTVLTQTYHDEVINRSNSLGRWKVVNPDYFLLEPVNLRVFCTVGRLNEKAASLYADEAVEFYKD